MTRLASFLLTVALLAGAASPIASHVQVPDGSSGEVCPMMTRHQPSSTPCMGEPCPCSHGSGSGSLTPDGTRLSPPEPISTFVAPVTRWTGLATGATDRLAGFAFRIDHPPHFPA